jgi:NAD(P)H-dependent FMN reductase
LDELGCDVQVYNPGGLPVRDPALENEVKVKELCTLTLWLDGHAWVSPEMHRTVTIAFKNQIDWIPLNIGSLCPTQGKILSSGPGQWGKSVIQCGKLFAHLGTMNKNAPLYTPKLRHQGVARVQRQRPDERFQLS